MTYLIEVMVPANIQAICCAREYHEAKEKSNRVYKLNQTDPARLAEIVRAVRTALPNQINVRLADRNFKNRAFMDGLMKWDAEHPNDVITPADLVKQISVATYTESFIGTTGKDKGKELHAFENVTFADGKKYPRAKYYVKIISPEAGKPIDVVSLHRTSDNYVEDTSKLGVYELSPAALKRFKQWKKSQT